jgi:hypothetical protein
MAFLKIKVMLLSLALDQLKKLEWRHCGGERKIAQEILNPLTLGGNRTLRGGQGFLFRRGMTGDGPVSLLVMIWCT